VETQITPELSTLLTVGGLAAVMMLATQFYKKWAPEDFIPHITTLLAILVAIGVSLLLGKASAVELATAAFVGFLAGCAASGYYKNLAPTGIVKPKE